MWRITTTDATARGHLFGHVVADAPTPNPLDLRHDVGKERCGITKTSARSLFGQLFGRAPFPDQPERHRNVVDAPLPCREHRLIPSFGCRLDAGRKPALRLEKMTFAGDEPKGREELRRRGHEKGVALAWCLLPVDRFEHAPSSRQRLFVTDEIGDMDDPLKERTEPLRVPGRPVDGAFEGRDDERPGIGKMVH